MKYLILAVLLMIVASLFQGVFFLVKDSGDRSRNRLAIALTVRIALSFLLFLLILASFLMADGGPMTS